MIKTKKISISKILIYIFLIGFAFTTIYPMVWVIQNSFKLSNDIIQSSFTLPTSLLLENYISAFSKLNIAQGYFNSLVISGTVVLAVLIIGSLASYILGRYNFKGKGLIKILITGSLLIPIFATILPVFDMLLSWKLIDNKLGVILPQIAGNLPFAILILSSFMSTIPVELEEAGKIEGCSRLQIFSKIIVPISKSSLATTAIFIFLWSYNDLFMSLIIMRSKDKMPINVLLTEISSQYGTDYGLMCAVIIMILLPVLLFYMIAQKQIVEGMTAGAIKG